jgi:hypothetical protein
VQCETMATTERAECTFVLKEGPEGQPLIAVEPSPAGLLIMFSVRPGASIQGAQELALHMRQGIVSVSVTAVSDGCQ